MNNFYEAFTRYKKVFYFLFLMALFFVSFCSRVLFLTYEAHQAYDGVIYHDTALKYNEMIANERVGQLMLYTKPLYYAVIMLSNYVFRNSLLMEVAVSSVFFSILNIVLVWYCARKLGGNFSGLLAVLLSSSLPVIYTVSKLGLSHDINSTFILLCFLSIVYYFKDTSTLYLLTSGACLVGALTTHPSSVLYYPLFVIVVVLYQIKNKKNYHILISLLFPLFLIGLVEVVYVFDVFADFTYPSYMLSIFTHGNMSNTPSGLDVLFMLKGPAYFIQNKLLSGAISAIYFFSLCYVFYYGFKNKNIRLLLLMAFASAILIVWSVIQPWKMPTPRILQPSWYLLSIMCGYCYGSLILAAKRYELKFQISIKLLILVLFSCIYCSNLYTFKQISKGSSSFQWLALTAKNIGLEHSGVVFHFKGLLKTDPEYNIVDIYKKSLLPNYLSSGAKFIDTFTDEELNAALETKEYHIVFSSSMLDEKKFNREIEKLKVIDTWMHVNFTSIGFEEERIKNSSPKYWIYKINTTSPDIR